MRDISIRATLGVRPPVKPHYILVITRGATASISYDLFNKVYTIDYIDQLTFIFKQGKNKWSYDLIEYFTETTDTIVDEDKEYFNRIESNTDSKYHFELLDLPVGARVPSNTYERYDLPDGVSTDNWQFNEHFAYESGENYAFINFMFDSYETMQFKQTDPTAPEDNIKFEVVTRLNTDALANMHSKDSIIINKQHDIAVIDSLYAGSSSNTSGDLVCSDDLTAV